MSNPSHAPTATKPTALTRAQALLRACVHCGFCNATCPTYALTGDEREGPRGRLYLMKDLLSGAMEEADLSPLSHCLSCRSCETTCPAGVHYTEILDTVREHTYKGQPFWERALDRMTEKALGAPKRLETLLRVARTLRPISPPALKRRIPARTPPLTWPPARHAQRIGLLLGCVQPALLPDLDTKAAVVLDRLGWSAVAVGPDCCGALPFHLQAHERAREHARGVLALQKSGGFQGFASTATGCTAFLHDYPRLFADGPESAEADRFATTVSDVAAWIDPEQLTALPPEKRLAIAWHAPCSLQHGLKGGARVEAILRALGHTLVPTSETALCCGSAGPYSIRHPRFARELGRRKWRALTGAQPMQIVTANVGCLQQLAAQSDRPVRHWLDLVYEALTNPDTGARDSR